MTTKDIFDHEAKQLVLSALDGYNVTIFAYGQTASGKTYTMRGNDHPDHQGIIPLALNEIFEGLNKQYGSSFSSQQQQLSTQQPKGSSNKSWNVKVSYMEIYNECVNDLLDPSKKNLDVRESHQRGIYIDHLSSFEVSSLKETINYLHKGDEQKIIAETKLNEKSSRSHTVFKIDIMVCERDVQTGKNLIKTSQINLVDLAGSEGVSRTKSQGVRFREGANINKSLLALSNVICKLGQKFQQGQKNYYINYRDSKLTRILQQALSGNSQTAIICTMSQLLGNYQESRETLNFGAKAKNIKTTVNLNELMKDSPDDLLCKLDTLTRENNQLRTKLRSQEDLAELLEQDKQDYSNSNLSYLKQHIDYLRQQLDEKHDIITLKEKEMHKIQDQLDDLLVNRQEIQDENAILKTCQEDLTLKLSQFLQSTQLQQNPSKQSPQKLIHNQFSEKNDSDIAVSGKIEVESLKSTIKALNQVKTDLESQITMMQNEILQVKNYAQNEKVVNNKIVQEYRMLKLECRKKDKLLSKKSLQINGLQDKIDFLENANHSLFKDLDQTIQGMSVILNGSHLELAEDDILLNCESSMLMDLGIQDPHLIKSPTSLKQAPSARQSLNVPPFFNSNHHKAQLLDLQTKLELALSDNHQLHQQRDLMQQDLDEAEAQILRLTQDIKDMDYNLMGVKDENEELENENQQIMSAQQIDEMTIMKQRDMIEQGRREQKKLIIKVEQAEEEIDRMREIDKKKEDIISNLKNELDKLKQESKKRRRNEFIFQDNSSSTAPTEDVFYYPTQTLIQLTASLQLETKRFKFNQPMNNAIKEVLDESQYSVVNFTPTHNYNQAEEVDNDIQQNKALLKQIQQQAILLKSSATKKQQLDSPQYQQQNHQYSSTKHIQSQQQTANKENILNQQNKLSHNFHQQQQQNSSQSLLMMLQQKIIPQQQQFNNKNLNDDLINKHQQNLRRAEQIMDEMSQSSILSATKNDQLSRSSQTFMNQSNTSQFSLKKQF